MRYPLPTFAAVITLVALAACAASAVTPPLDDEGDGDSGTKSDRGNGPGDPNPAGDAGADARKNDSDGGCISSKGPSPNLVINELDYDQPDADTAEFVEIYNRGDLDVPLDGLAVVLFNGANGLEYQRYPLSGGLARGGYLVIGTPGAVDAGSATFINLITTNGGLQNGPRDAVAIVDTRTNEVIDSLSYDGVLEGPCPLSEGTALVAEDLNDAVGSLIRSPNGNDTNNANTDWKLTSTPTPGAPNVE